MTTLQLPIGAPLTQHPRFPRVLAAAPCPLGYGGGLPRWQTLLTFTRHSHEPLLPAPVLRQPAPSIMRQTADLEDADGAWRHWIGPDSDSA